MGLIIDVQAGQMANDLVILHHACMHNEHCSLPTIGVSLTLCVVPVPVHTSHGGRGVWSAGRV